jgi:hypothetical protein
MGKQAQPALHRVIELERSLGVLRAGPCKILEVVDDPFDVQSTLMHILHEGGDGLSHLGVGQAHESKLAVRLLMRIQDLHCTGPSFL